MSDLNDRSIHVVDPDPRTASWLQSHLADTDVEVVHFATADDYGNERPLPWLLIANGDTAGGRRLCDRFQNTETEATGGVVLTSASVAVPELLARHLTASGYETSERVSPVDTARRTRYYYVRIQ